MSRHEPRAGSRPGEPASGFVVRGRRRNGMTTYLCPDASWALRKRVDFERLGYEDITVTGPDGSFLDERELERRAHDAQPTAVAGS